MERNADKKSQAVVEVIDYGPLKITGKIIIKDLKRDKEEKIDEVLLCRCGNSANKPFCDCSHEK
jgi:CDGSH-type Zn-finger protein